MKTPKSKMVSLQDWAHTPRGPLPLWRRRKFQDALMAQTETHKSCPVLRLSSMYCRKSLSQTKPGSSQSRGASDPQEMRGDR